MFRSFGIWEIALILVIILIVFGVGKLPQVGNAIGKGLRSFKKAQAGEEEEVTADISRADNAAKKEAKS
ncbi:MAG: preprotein translocase subunit SecA [Chloroflexi bacterium RBG_16_50_9]|nr:MAG: preprotein translocase subunit SecA [Chloroflexi bacterium RBG_16_50_9]